ncbi:MULTISPECIES: hypothetical protein [unclassified Flavobacterium]|jgi:hypothetical protein|uniref:hypothetical protein n=1 Tax=unclassified Flavobacterium TaxID=196869 RepID=UPI00068E633D|nr:MULTISPECIES: hypothetical protein [unclassified Flavobacterium]MEA9413021.1 hypothetical protein [Flavobacterium sp. PL02]OUL61268.1 hypothetical protein B8T70_15900 [Flavobacterium sp. AJR]
MSSQTQVLENHEPILGGWTDFRKPTAADLLLFKQALEGYVGVKYIPTAVATQVVAGINYRFRCTASIPPSEIAYEAIVKIFKPLVGDPHVVKITRI